MGRPSMLSVAVGVGVVALLAGAVGFVALLLSPVPVTSAPRLRLAGHADDASLDVVVRWREGPDLVSEEARPSGRAGEWVLPPLPAHQEVTVVVRDRSTKPPRRLASLTLTAPPPPVVTLDLASREHAR